MRERAAALQLGEQENLGEFRCFASHSFGHDWIFFTPLGLSMLAAGCWELVREHSWPMRTAGAACAIIGLALACLPLAHRFDRRVGSDVPRLYCFTDGLVIGVVRTLMVYRWTDLTIDTQKWTRGSGETYDYGTSITVKSAANGKVLAYFDGNEPSRANAWTVLSLHKSALKHAEASDATPAASDPEAS